MDINYVLSVSEQHITDHWGTQNLQSTLTTSTHVTITADAGGNLVAQSSVSELTETIPIQQSEQYVDLTSVFSLDMMDSSDDFMFISIKASSLPVGTELVSSATGKALAAIQTYKDSEGDELIGIALELGDGLFLKLPAGFSGAIIELFDFRIRPFIELDVRCKGLAHFLVLQNNISSMLTLSTTINSAKSLRLI
jgi:hypothetical protein